MICAGVVVIGRRAVAVDVGVGSLVAVGDAANVSPGRGVQVGISTGGLVAGDSVKITFRDKQACKAKPTISTRINSLFISSHKKSQAPRAWLC